VDPSIDYSGYNGCSCFTDVQATEFHPNGIFDAGRSASNLSPEVLLMNEA
jgi:hypothetical protein